MRNTFADIVRPRAEEAGDEFHRTGKLLTLSGRKTGSGERVTPARALTLPAYFASIRNIAEDIAKLPFALFERMEPRGRRRAIEHPVYDLIKSEPNPEMGSMSFWESRIGNALGWGRAPAEIERNEFGEPVALWPIHPSRARRVRRNGALFLENRIDDIEGGRLGDVVLIPDRDVYYLHGFGGNGLDGYSLAQAIAAETIGTSLAAELFAASFFGNGATLGLILRHPGELSDDAKKNIRESMREHHQGAGQAFNVHVLEEGMEVDKMTAPPRDAQLIETRQFNVVNVARILRMPPHKIQSMESATFANIEHQGIEYHQDALHPWMTRICQEADRKLLSREERRRLHTRHVVKAIMFTDHTTRANYYRTLFNLGAMSPNDIRENEEENPIESEAGDGYYIQRNMALLDDVAGDGDEPEEEPAVEDQADAAQQMEPLFVDAAARVLRREKNAVERHARGFGDRTQFVRWVNRFMPDQREFARVTFAPVVATLCAMLGRPEPSLDAALDRLHAAGLERAQGTYEGRPAEASAQDLARDFMDTAREIDR